MNKQPMDSIPLRYSVGTWQDIYSSESGALVQVWTDHEWRTGIRNEKLQELRISGQAIIGLVEACKAALEQSHDPVVERILMDALAAAGEAA